MQHRPSSPLQPAQHGRAAHAHLRLRYGAGSLTREVIEPNTSSLGLQTDCTYDAFGNKTRVTVSGIADIANSGIDAPVPEQWSHWTEVPSPTVNQNGPCATR